MHNNPECLIVGKCHVMALVPHPPTPPLPFVEPSLPSSTESSPSARNRITSPCRGHAVAMPGRTLLERVRDMGHAVWLPIPPPGPAMSGLATPTVPDQTPAHMKAGDTAPVSTRETAHPSSHSSRMRKQRQQPCSIEEKGMPSMSSEQAPLRRAPLDTPHRHACRFGDHSPAAQTNTHARPQTLVHRARPSVRENGATLAPPSPRAQPARL
jgi:hypothetical protein